MINILIFIALMTAVLAAGWKLCAANVSNQRLVHKTARDAAVCDEADMGEVR